MILLGIFLGLFIGGCVGVIVMSLIQIGRDEEDDEK